VPIVALAIQLAPTTHPEAGIFQGGVKGLMLVTLLLSISAFTALYVLFMAVGISIKKDERDLAGIKEAMKE